MVAFDSIKPLINNSGLIYILFILRYLLVILHFKFITYCDLNEQGEGEAPNKEGKIEG